MMAHAEVDAGCGDLLTGDVMSVVVSYDEDRVASVSAELGEAIDAAALGRCGWDIIPHLLAGAFPGAMVAFSNDNFTMGTVAVLAVTNIDPDFLKSYMDHFAFVNPWAVHWNMAASGQILIAEDLCPSRLYSQTEFYNDWLKPQGIEAAVAIKIDAGRGDLIRLPMHYPLQLAPTYDGAAAEVLSRVRGNLGRAVELGLTLRKRTEQAIAGAALVERASCAAFVVDGTCHLCDANQAAVELFSSGLPLAVRHGRVHLAERRADGMFRNNAAALASGLPTELCRIPVRVGEGSWLVSLAALPPAAGMMIPGTLLASRPMILVFVRDADVRKRRTSDLSVLSMQFGLTRAEILFCERLLCGDSLDEAAMVLGIARETARDRIKVIFHKTGVHRQGELVAMLARSA